MATARAVCLCWRFLATGKIRNERGVVMRQSGLGGAVGGRSERYPRSKDIRESGRESPRVASEYSFVRVTTRRAIDAVRQLGTMVPVWEKFILVVSLSGLNALTRLPLGKWRDDPDLLALYEAALRETVAVGFAEGVRLPPDSVEKTLATMHSMPPHHTTAMGTDLLRGNRLELPWFAGKVIELGRRHNIPTPVNGFIYSALKPYVDGAAY
jgi:2-dehydropantoate 2-reductase